MTIGQNCVPDLSDYFLSHQIHSEREGYDRGVQPGTRRHDSVVIVESAVEKNGCLVMLKVPEKAGRRERAGRNPERRRQPTQRH